MGDSTETSTRAEHAHRAGRFLLRLCIAIVATVVALLVVVTYTEVLELDINSGRLRDRKVVAGLSLWTSVSETKFSKMAAPFVDPEVGSNWRTVNDSAPLNPLGLFSHPRYHGAQVVLDMFVASCEFCDLDGFVPPDRERVIEDILASLKNDKPEQVEAIVRKFSNQSVRKVYERNGKPPPDLTD